MIDEICVRRAVGVAVLEVAQGFGQEICPGDAEGDGERRLEMTLKYIEIMCF